MEPLVSSSPVRRSENLSPEQRQFLLRKIQEFQETLNDKRNDLRTIHRKKEAWVRITAAFNCSFPKEVRRRTTQQIQTWFKNEKARRRRQLLRMQERRFRLKTSPESPQPSPPLGPPLLSGPALQPVITGTDPSSAPLPILTGNRPSSAQLPVITGTDPTSAQLPILAGNSPSSTQLPVLTGNGPSSAQLAVLTENDPTCAQMPVLTGTEPATEASFHLSPQHPFLEDPSPMPSAGDPASDHEFLLARRDPQDDSQQAGRDLRERLFQREMALLEVKEECVRRHYERKGAVLAVKERYYRMKIEMLQQQAGPSAGTAFQD